MMDHFGIFPTPQYMDSIVTEYEDVFAESRNTPVFKYHQGPDIHTLLTHDATSHQQDTFREHKDQPVWTSSHVGQPVEAIERSSSTTESRLSKKRCTGRALDWEAQRDTVRSLYMDQGMTLDATMQKMAQRGFRARRTFKQKTKEWKMGKNLTSALAKFMNRKARQRRDESNKATIFKFRGTLVPEHKWNRSVLTDDDAVVSAETPPGIDYSTPRLSVESDEQLNVKDVSRPIELVWNGLSVDGLIALHQTAESAAAGGNYAAFLNASNNSLEGLSVLLTPTHTIFQDEMARFLDTANKYQLHEEACSSLEKYMNKAIQESGGTHPKTLWFLERLGSLLFAQNKLFEAEIIWKRYLEGVSQSTDFYAEDKFDKSRKVWEQLIRIACDASDQVRARDILETWIQSAEKLGSDYYSVLMQAKYTAARIYFSFYKPSGGSESILYSRAPFRMGERYLEEHISWATANYSQASRVTLLHSCRILMQFYLESQQWDKLAAICVTIDRVMNGSEPSSSTSVADIFKTKAFLALAKTYLQSFDEARTILEHLQSEIDNQPDIGSQTTLAFRAALYHLISFIRQDYATLVHNGWDLTESLALEARVTTQALSMAGDTSQFLLGPPLRTPVWSLSMRNLCKRLEVLFEE